MFFVNIVPDSERQRENGANQPIRQTGVCINCCFHLSPLKSTLPFTLFTDKTRTINSQFSPPHTQDLQPTKSTAPNSHLLLLSPHWGRSIQTSPLQPSYNMSSRPNSPHTFSKQSLPHSYQHSHTLSTHLSSQAFSHCVQAGSGNPTAKKKTTLNTSLIENYRPFSLLPFITKTLERVVFNQVSLFLSQNNKLDAEQSGFRSGHSTETALLSVTEALRIAKADSKSSVLILLDLSAAFDTVNHQIILSTFSSLGITRIPLRWF